ncbi:hypothetical protein HUT19_18705 [Streptomyces sp. NA02950]|uniref:DUF6274 family protein n=1 Tax=Streptomyces sp. NA02950 TaxID=2742137 RepID=UPI00158FA28A|nr:DUF6274 family protein [Streptomyces sp. NA02950]QKV90352.1 hypothetical protein HUT19_18705 [Streptomyces sp. NA02950]
MATSAKHETRALLRAHLAAATGYRHLTRHCPICHRLLRLAMEPTAADEGRDAVREEPSEEPAARESGREPEPFAPPSTR